MAAATLRSALLSSCALRRLASASAPRAPRLAQPKVSAITRSLDRRALSRVPSALPLTGSHRGAEGGRRGSPVLPGRVRRLRHVDVVGGQGGAGQQPGPAGRGRPRHQGLLHAAGSKPILPVSCFVLAAD